MKQKILFWIRNASQQVTFQHVKHESQFTPIKNFLLHLKSPENPTLHTCASELTTQKVPTCKLSPWTNT